MKEVHVREIVYDWREGCPLPQRSTVSSLEELSAISWIKHHIEDPLFIRLSYAPYSDDITNHGHIYAEYSNGSWNFACVYENAISPTIDWLPKMDHRLFKK